MLDAIAADRSILCNRANEPNTHLSRTLSYCAGNRRGTLHQHWYAGKYFLHMVSQMGVRWILAAGKDMHITGSENVHLYLVSRQGGSIEDPTPDVDNDAAVTTFSGF